MIVVISLHAEADIEDIASYVARENPAAARRVGRDLYDACAELTPYPERFAVADKLGRDGVRRCPVGEYLIFYVVRSEDVFVLRVVHGRRDHLRLFAE